jgi:60 kDa SS-A/Ro ribonucleoprotein
MGPQALRMNLNTLARHGVFGEEPGIVGRLLAAVLPSKLASRESMAEYVAARLADEGEIRRSRQFPYQYFAAYLNAAETIPHAIRAALHRAAELACGNVPRLPGPVVIGLDTSGSMQSPATGDRGRGATSKMRCVDVAALVAAALLRTNPDSRVVPFDTAAYDAAVDPSDSILSLAERLAKFGGGGTDCSLPLRKANTAWRDRRFAGVVLVSDNESWVYRGRAHYTAGSATGVMGEWQEFVQNQRRLAGANSPAPKLICIDIQPNATTQAPERSDILNVGGFSDAVFDVIAAFLKDDAGRFVAEIEAVEL